MSLAADTIAVARSQLGVTEHPAGSNRTPYGAWYGADAEPWCASFVSWCLWRAGHPINVETPKGFAWTVAGVSWAKAHGYWLEPRQLQFGDVVFFNFDHDAGPEHVGFLLAQLGEGQVRTLEGNTGPTSDANGGQVQQRTRNYAVVLGGFRPSRVPRSSYDMPARPLPPAHPTIPPQPTPAAVPIHSLQEDDMAAALISADGITVYATDGVHRRWVHTMTELRELVDAGAARAGVRKVSRASLEALPLVGTDAS